MFEVRALGSVKVSGDEVVKLHSIVQALTPHPSYTYIVLQALCARICGAYSNGGGAFEHHSCMLLKPSNPRDDKYYRGLNNYHVLL